MNKIEKNDIRLLSHMIYTIYSTEDLRQMRLEFLKLLKYIIPFDTANFFLVNSDPDCNYTLTDPVNVNSLKNPDVAGVLKEYMEHCFEIDSTHWLCNTKKSIAYRSTDFLSEASLENTQYYREMFLPFDLHFGAQAVLAHNDDCVGLLTLFRSKESPNSVSYTHLDVYKRQAPDSSAIRSMWIFILPFQKILPWKKLTGCAGSCRTILKKISKM